MWVPSANTSKRLSSRFKTRYKFTYDVNIKVWNASINMPNIVIDGFTNPNDGAGAPNRFSLGMLIIQNIDKAGFFNSHSETFKFDPVSLNKRSNDFCNVLCIFIFQNGF